MLFSLNTQNSSSVIRLKCNLLIEQHYWWKRKCYVASFWDKQERQKPKWKCHVTKLFYLLPLSILPRIYRVWELKKEEEFVVSSRNVKSVVLSFTFIVIYGLHLAAETHFLRRLLRKNVKRKTPLCRLRKTRRTRNVPLGLKRYTNMK